MTRKEDWNGIIGATFMTSFFFLDPSSLGTGMTRGGIGMTKKGGYWDDEKGGLE